MQTEPFTVRVEVPGSDPVDIRVDADEFTITSPAEVRLLADAARVYGASEASAAAGAITVLALRELPDVPADDLLAAVAGSFGLEEVTE